MANDEIVTFIVRSKVCDVEISGWAYIDELDDEAPLRFVNHIGLPAGHYVPSNVYAVDSVQYSEYSRIASAFQSDDLFLQYLNDFCYEFKTVDRGDYLLIINEGERL